MEKILFLSSMVFLLNVGGFANSQPNKETEKDNFEYKEIKHSAFGPGEVLEYKLAYGWINAGTAKLSVNATENKIQGREVLHMVGEGQSASAFDWIFKVRDKYETYMDRSAVFPWLFVRRISEGGYDKAQDYKFFQNLGYVTNEKQETYQIPYGVQDMLSAFYFARTMDFSNAKKGQIFEFQAFVDEEIYPVRMKFMGKENVKIKRGKFDCLVFNPAVQEGRIFESDEDLTVYITNDNNHIPILVRAKVLVGSIRMELTDYKNLANPVAKIN